ncbi:MAG: prolyl oligopeptidase family serine peptidase [Bacteroides sp.]|nr:prolyl oligopeptidase family serine peptidase [Bacteroides sp.]
MNSINTGQYEKWFMPSTYLAKPVSVLVYRPVDYNPDKSYPLLYLLHGYGSNFTEWARMIDCCMYTNLYKTIIIYPEGFESFYVNSPVRKESQYEDFFFKELVQKVHGEFNVDDKNVFITGLSMGGYGALRYFIRHPDYFNSAGATSGAIDIEYLSRDEISSHFQAEYNLKEDLDMIFGDTEIIDRNQYNILTLLNEIPDFHKPFIFDCGREDLIYPTSIELYKYAKNRNLPFTFISQPGGHNTAYWKRSIDYHFIYFKQQRL